MFSTINYNKFPLKDFMNQKFADYLPGIFYLYELTKEGAQIKVWNKNHETVTGYNSKETINKSPMFFLDKQFHNVIQQEIQNTTNIGFVDKVYANIYSKQGDLIPYVFEGYKFMAEGRYYFMGLGIDVSELVGAKEQIRYLRLNKTKKEDIMIHTLREQQKEEILNTVLSVLINIKKNGLDKINLRAIESLNNEIKSFFPSKGNWQKFRNLFTGIQHQFFGKLRTKHPNLTQTELQYCAYIKIHMNWEQICNIMNISRESLIKKRYRLKKKFNLEKGERLDTYILSF